MWSKLVSVCALLLLISGGVGCPDTTLPNDYESHNNLSAGLCDQSTIYDPPADSLKIVFIDVGFGDSTWIQSPVGNTASLEPGGRINILVDAGDTGYDGRIDGGKIVTSYLESHGLPAGSVLDAVVLTHPHSDHYGGLTSVFSTYQVRWYLDPGKEIDNVGYQSTLTSIRNKINSNKGTYLEEPHAFAVPVASPSLGLIPSAPYRIDAFGQELFLSILSAGVGDMGKDENDIINNTSIVLKMSWGGVRVLMMGDVEEEREHELLNTISADPALNLSADILRVGHHGSSTSSTPEFLAEVFADNNEINRYAVISSGRKTFGGVYLPRQETLDRLAGYVPSQNLFMTTRADDGKSEGEEGDDDTIVLVITSDGQVTMCYEKSDPSDS